MIHLVAPLSPSPRPPPSLPLILWVDPEKCGQLLHSTDTLWPGQQQQGAQGKMVSLYRVIPMHGNAIKAYWRFRMYNYTVCQFLLPVQLSESVLVRDLIFVFQNIEGEHIHYDSKDDAFRLDKTVSIN